MVPQRSPHIWLALLAEYHNPFPPCHARHRLPFCQANAGARLLTMPDGCHIVMAQGRLWKKRANYFAKPSLEQDGIKFAFFNDQGQSVLQPAVAGDTDSTTLSSKGLHVERALHPPVTPTTAAPEPQVLGPFGTAGPSAPWAISLSIILGSLTHSLMMGSINVAVPTMMTSLRVDVVQIQWVSPLL